MPKIDIAQVPAQPDFVMERDDKGRRFFRKSGAPIGD